jgi:hypothetical protein
MPTTHEVFNQPPPREGYNLFDQDRARAALFCLLSEMEADVLCPIAMAYSVVPALRLQPFSALWRFLSE